MENDARLRERLRRNEEAERSETAMPFRDEILPGKDPFERELGFALVRRIIADAVQLADVLQNAIQHHRARLVRGIGNDVALRMAPFVSENHRSVGRADGSQVCFYRPLCPLFQMNRLFCGLLALILGASSASGAEQERIADLYARGLAGNEKAVIDCIAALEARLTTQPDDQLARVYLGSAWTLRSRDLSISPGKLSALRKGIALMDEAAAAAPNDAKVLLLRAVTEEALPVFLGRRKAAREQLNELVALLEKDPLKLSPADQQLLYLNAGEAAQRAGEKARARALWERGLAIAADAKLKAEIRTALEEAR
jgi:hypothetical protein